MFFDVLTLFPEMFSGFQSEALISRAVENGLLGIRTTNIRDFSRNRHKKVDDYPFGGGSGMLMTPEPVFLAHEHVMSLRDNREEKRMTLFMSPAGRKLDQETVVRLSTMDHLVILCGRYEGVDQRVIDALVDEEISIGDYVLFGGEVPAMVLMEAVSRYVPGVLGNQESLTSESFSDGLLEYPQYTKPRVFRDMEVPEVLLSGNHQLINQWRESRALERTRTRRPDLLESQKDNNQ